jgi:hypothetical protein
MKGIRGISNANKGKLMAGMAYSLKKYLKFTKNRVEIATKSAEKHWLDFFEHIWPVLRPNPSLIV